MATAIPLSYETVQKLTSRSISRDATMQIKKLRELGFTRDDALVAIMGKPEHMAEAIAKYPEIVLPEIA